LRERAFVATSAILFIASTAGTIALGRSMPAGMAMPGGWTMSMAWMRMPGQSWPVTAVSFLGMWIVMMVAMMLPSLVPMLWRYREAVGMKGETRLGRLTALVGVGYFLVWVDLPGRSCFKDVPLRSQTFRSRGPDSLVTQGEPALEIGRVS